MSRSQGAERRRFPRINRTLVIHYHLIDNVYKDPHLDNEFVGSSINISAGGMLLRTTVALPLDANVDLRFRLSKSRDEMTVTARILRYETTRYSGLYYIPVEFMSISPQERAVISEFVLKHQINPVSEV